MAEKEQEVQPTTEQAKEAQVATEQAKDVQPATEQPVPYDRFKEVNDAKKEAERQAAEAKLKAEAAELAVEQLRLQQANPVQQAPKTLFQQAVEQLGLPQATFTK